ncbi:MAG TPA: lmo0937 family membrane protein [Candidatus Paceibacterota bacterium]
MLFMIAGLLALLWFVGLVTSTTLGGYVHLLLVFAVIVALLALIRNERAR